MGSLGTVFGITLDRNSNLFSAFFFSGLPEQRGGWPWPPQPASGRPKVEDFPLATNRQKLGGLSGVRAVAAGAAHSVAVTSKGQVWAWGSHAFGQLGTGDEIKRPAPTAARTESETGLRETLSSKRRNCNSISNV